MFAIARHEEGVSLNPLEFALDTDGKLLQWNTAEEAKAAFFGLGGTQKDLDDSIYYIYDLAKEEVV